MLDINQESGAQKGAAFEGVLTEPPYLFRQWELLGNPAFFFSSLIDEFGDFIHYRGFVNFYLVNHPDLVGRVLKETHRNFDKNSIIYNRFQQAMGDGLVTAEGERWKRQRKLIQPMFRPGAIRGYFDLMLDATEKLAERWESRLGSKQRFNIAEEMNCLALEVAGRALFSSGFDRSVEMITKWTRSINRYCAKPPIPVLTDLRFPSPTNLRLKRTLVEYGDFIQSLINERRKGALGDDLLATLINARDEATGEAMTDYEIAEEAMAMVIGGHETTSSALTWVWFELNQHPEVTTKLRAEIKNVTDGKQVTFEQVGELIFLRMVIEEVLRLHPPFWFENRNVFKDVELGGVTIPKGAMIVFSRYALQRHANFWDEPDQFRPERFEPGQEENAPNSAAHIPFGVGPRVCVGRHFAMMELMIVVATLLQRYQIIADLQYTNPMRVEMTMELKYGLMVRLEPNTIRT